MTVKEKAQDFALTQALNYIAGSPEKNLPRLLGLLDMIGGKSFANQSKALHAVFDNPEGNWYRFIMSLWRDIDDEVLRATLRNFGLYVGVVSYSKQQENAKRLGCNVPWALLLDPTSACNLKCTGCWAAEYGNRLNLSYDELESIIRQANELGTQFFLFSGGEPLIRKADIIRLCEHILTASLRRSPMGR
jgi:sulfatase maturation enzyme AslB (radical SAM superfamily)